MGSTSGGAPAPIIVVRKKGGHGGHHGGAWKVAYADFVTAMMALFIVLWLLASDEKVKKAVGSYFSDPTGQGKMMGTTQAGVGDALTVNKDNMDNLKKQLENVMRELPKFEQMKANVQMTVTGEGLRIELMEKEGGMFFDSGSAHISGSGAEMLAVIGKQLAGMQNDLLIEGHTDAKPYASTTGYTNWELSADRANTARRILMESGIVETRIAQVRGFSAQQLKLKDQPENPGNRRVSLIVKYRELPRAAAQKAPAPKAGAPEPAKPAPGH
jgi:chemotaxis protein MotB